MNPTTEVRCITLAEEYHTSFGRSWKIQEFLRDRVASWMNDVQPAITKHLDSLADERSRDLYRPNFVFIKGRNMSLPVLELPLVPVGNQFEADYIFPYNKKNVRMSTSNFLENYQTEPASNEDQVREAWLKAWDWFKKNTGACVHFYL